MKKTFKILTITLTLVLLAGVCGFAAGEMQNIWVEFNSINLVVDGKAVDASNILYNGTTYVPLRRTAEILGKEVNWDGMTNTAYIQGGTTAPTNPVVPPSKANIKEVKEATRVMYDVGRMRDLAEYIESAYDSITLYMDCIIDSFTPGNTLTHARGYISKAEDTLIYLNKEKDFVITTATKMNIDVSGVNSMYQNAVNCIEKMKQCVNSAEKFGNYKGNSDYNNYRSCADDSFYSMLDCEKTAVTLYLDAYEYIKDFPEN